MIGVRGHSVEEGLSLARRASQALAYRALPHFLLSIIEQYLRVDFQGAENIPKTGPYILIANHSGYMGFDAVMINHEISKFRKVVPRIIAHKLWFLTPAISVRAERLGLVPATYQNGLKTLNEGRPLLLFPEGEEGNFKPTRFRYRLRPFRRGFLRLALATGVPVIPITVVGAEETHITLTQVRWAKELLGIIIPVPLNVIPLPARWKITVHQKLEIPKDIDPSNIDEISAYTNQSRRNLQRLLTQEVHRRNFVFL